MATLVWGKSTGNESILARDGWSDFRPCFPATASRRLPTASLESSPSFLADASPVELSRNRLYTILVKRQRWKALLTLGTGDAERRSERKLRHDRRKRAANPLALATGSRTITSDRTIIRRFLFSFELAGMIYHWIEMIET